MFILFFLLVFVLFATICGWEVKTRPDQKASIITRWLGIATLSCVVLTFTDYTFLHTHSPEHKTWEIHLIGTLIGVVVFNFTQKNYKLLMFFAITTSFIVIMYFSLFFWSNILFLIVLGYFVGHLLKLLNKKNLIKT